MILDTNAVSDLLEDEPPEILIRHLLTTPPHHLPVVVLGEIRFGIQFSRMRAEMEAKLSRLKAVSIILVVDEATSDLYAAFRADLRRRGSPIPDNDLWIAALAKQHNLPVVTNDDHFRRVQGLQIISW